MGASVVGVVVDFEARISIFPMHDLLLWRLLRHRRYQAEELLPLLDEFAQWPLDLRRPFLGFLPPAAVHLDGKVRRAAVNALRGARGTLALRLLITALNDPDADVCQAAVGSLRESTLGGDWARWAHVLFHPDAALRRAAVDPDRVFPPPDWQVLYLLPDPDLGEAIRQRHDLGFLPPAALPLLFDYVQDGLVSRAWARKRAARMVWLECWSFFADGISRPDADVATVLAAVERPGGDEAIVAHPSPDGLDDFFALFWPGDGETDAQAAEVSDSFFDQLAGDLRGEDGGDWRRVVASLIVTAVRHGRWPPGAARLCAGFLPEFLVCPWVPRETRYPAVAVLYQQGAPGTYPPDTVRQWLDADVCRHSSGRLDLWAAGGFLRLLAGNPFEQLFQWFPLETIVAAFRADLDRAVAVLSLADRSSRARNYLIRALLAEPRPERGRLLALVARAVPADGLDFLDPLDGPGACDLLEHLLWLTAPPARPLGENKIRRLADLLAGKIQGGQIGPFLLLWLVRPAPEEDTLALAVLGRLGRYLGGRLLLQAVCNLPARPLLRFLSAANACAGLPYAWEMLLAARLAAHPEEAVRAWAEPRVRHLAEQPGAAPVEPAPFKVGLCAQLRGRPDPSEPDLETCAALLACHDPLGQVDEQFARFGSADSEFLDRLDEEMVRVRMKEWELPLLGHAWLYRWDEHARAFAARCTELGGDLASALRILNTLTVPVLRLRCWLALGRLLDIWHWRDRPRLEEAQTEALARLLADTLPTAEGDLAAAILVRWRERDPASEVLDRLAPSVRALLPDLGQPIRDILQPWIDSRGLAAPAEGEVIAEPSENGADLAQRIRTSTDPDFLGEQACQSDPAVGRQAIERLLALGGSGERRLAELFGRLPPPPFLHRLADSIPRWKDETALAEVRALLRQADAVPEVRYRVGEALYQRGERDVVTDMVDAVRRPAPVGWFEDSDWVWLSSGEDMRDLSLKLALSPHPHAHQPAVEHLAGAVGPDEEVRQALTSFLETGTERMRDARIQAAKWLYGNGGRETALPFLLQGEPDDEPLYHPQLLAAAPFAVVEAVVKGFLMAGEGEEAERMIFALLRADGVDPFARQEGFSLLLQHGESAEVRKDARKQLLPGLGRAHKLRRLADTFAWGVRVGRELTGKLFTLEMISSEKLGYTRFSENKLYITPLPILRGEPHGRDVVQALILHELGHHLYHRGELAEAIWKRAEEEKLHSLLNLVADEHLERNLRARGRDFGDRLKLLAAYAFQHTTREFPVGRLLGSLQGRAFEVLTHIHLGFARREGCVAVENGRILAAMERAGLSFARFVRALRMGLGNRHNDPRVDEALALFKDRFRHSDMPRLLDIARKLRDLFGREAEMLDSFDPEDSFLADDDEMIARGEGVSNDELQSEIQRSLQPRRGRSGEPRDTGGGRGLNLGPEEDFNPITKVVPIPYDPAQHAAYAQQVARPALKMRAYLHDLGLGLEPQRFRVRGKSLDRTRLRAVVLRGDPRMFTAREPQTKTDLFLGVVIDCSGSMSYDDKIERAKLFGTLLAEAARDQPGIDLRLYGFTDKVIYDAGRAARCAVAGLQADGGNNDAAGLWHAAQEARASRRKAKLLVMISDGSPTECSVNALKALVNRLTRRWKMCCAQVAVCPLDHVCFPNYIVLEEGNPEVSVRQFGLVMARLVRQALRGG
jgi:hypothetical protein